MSYYHKKTNMICFEESEIKNLFEMSRKARILDFAREKGYTLKDISTDKTKGMEIVDMVVSEMKGKEDIEIFLATYSFLNFYPGSKICFILKGGIDPNKVRIDSLEKLKSSLREDCITDFGIMSDDGLRAFQLKSYRENTEVVDFAAHIKKVLLRKYANDLGDVNLLFTMMSKGNFEGNFFHELHEELKDIKIKGGGNILVSYNEDNKFDVLNTVYPVLDSKRLPHIFFSKKQDA